MLGEMRELGTETEALHRELGELVGRGPFDLLVTVGKAARAIAAGARAVGGGTVVECEDLAGARQELLERLGPNDVVLIKGSRAIGMEALVAAIEDALTGERSLVAPRRVDDVRIDDQVHWDTVLGAMHDVMQNVRGTAYAVGMNAPYQMAGKSGTAQVFSVAQEDEYEEEEVAERLRDHALFISFAPFDDPRIAVAVIVENGSSGSRVAAPIARAIMDEYLGYGSNASQ